MGNHDFIGTKNVAHRYSIYKSALSHKPKGITQGTKLNKDSMYCMVDAYEGVAAEAMLNKF